MAGEGEFDFIARALAPLTEGHDGADGLTDDGAILAPTPGHAFAVTTDTLVEGVHFPQGEDPRNAAWKALAANVSDLVAMGAQPKTYLLNVVWPKSGFETRAEGFVEGLREAQNRFGVTLVGGDTTRADGLWTVSITAIGEVPDGRTPRRGHARPGDVLVLTGPVGDAWLGLQQHLGAIRVDDPAARDRFDRCFRRPEPPVELADMIGRSAHAAIDVSDGLLADIVHILDASGVGAKLELADLPLSGFAASWVEAQPDPLSARLKLAAGGDDYEIAAAMPEHAVSEFVTACETHGRTAVLIGRVTAGAGLSITFNGERVEPGVLGFTHF